MIRRPTDKTAAQNSEPNAAERLDFGHAVQVSKNDTASRTLVPIAAHMGGPNGSAVRFVCMGRRSAISENFDVRRVEIPLTSMVSQFEAWWSGNGEPVQQVRFAASTGPSSTWIAIRQRSILTILHPVVYTDPEIARHAVGGALPLSQDAPCLDVHPVLSLPITRTGGHPLADVAFHPSDHTVLALIDEHGNWSVWHLRSQRSRHVRPLSQIHLQYEGKYCPSATGKSGAFESLYYDGWHRISWLGKSEPDRAPVLVSNRGHSALIQPEVGLPSPVDLRLGLPHERQRVLDVKIRKLDTCYFFVLTSTRLLVSRLTDRGKRNDAHHDTVVLCSWHHFRSRRDYTLQLSLIETRQCKWSIPLIESKWLI